MGATANYVANPTTGVAPLAVNFTDASTGRPTSWSWDFGDGTTSTLRNPSHSYAKSGVYTVALTVRDNGGVANVITKTDEISAAGGIVYRPTDDAYVASASPTQNFGTASNLRVYDSGTGSQTQSFLKFNVQGLASAPSSAKLRLYVNSQSKQPDSVYLATDTSPPWSQSTLTWPNRPQAIGAALDTQTPAATGRWLEFNLGSSVGGNGTYTFAVTGGGTTAAAYSSNEEANPPQLVLGGASTVPVTADFSAIPTSGSAPLMVAFHDQSGGVPTSWSWDFGDGSTSTAQNPIHSYGAPGTYTVSLTVQDADGNSDTATKTNLINVTPSALSLTLLPTDDAYVKSGSPKQNFGSDSTLRVYSASSQTRSFLKFNVQGLSGTPASAMLRLWVSSPSKQPDSLYQTAETNPPWTQTTLTWLTQPTTVGSALDSETPAVKGAWLQFDLGSAITGNGTYGFALTGGGSTAAIYSSSEGTNPPQLMITTG